MIRSRFTLLLSSLLILLSGCGKPEARQSEKMDSPTKASSIVVDVGEELDVLHEAQPGQMLEWKSDSPKTPNFWIQFAGPSPCANGALVLAGSVSKAASCVARSSSGGNEAILYAYYIRSSSPPPLPPQTPTSDRIIRCPGCNN